MSKKIAIILVNWNGYSYTNDCIHSLQNASYTGYDIIVVDNGSADGSAAKLQLEHPGIILIPSTVNRGFAGGNNMAMEYAIQKGYEYSLLLNNDTFVEPGFLEPMVEYLEAHPNTAAVQPKIFFAHNRNLLWNAGSFFNRWWGIARTRGYAKKDRSAYQQTEKVDWITGCAFFVRNGVLQKSGLFAEKMFTYYEDVDLSFRIVQLGYDLIYLPAAVVYHIAGVSGKTVAKGKEGYLNASVHYYNVRNRIWILKKYTSAPYIPTVCLFHFFYFSFLLLYFLVRGRFQKLAACIKGIIDGIKGQIA